MGRLYSRSLLPALMVLISLCLSPAVRGAEIPNISDEQREQTVTRAEECLKKGSVDRHVCVDDIFAAARLCAWEGREEEAYDYYTAGLKAKSWAPLERLELARLMHKRGEDDAARENAMWVKENAKDKSVKAGALSLLEKLPVTGEKDTVEVSAAEGLEIVIVPLGRIDHDLMLEVVEKLAEFMGVDYRVLDVGMSLGASDRSLAERNRKKAEEMYTELQAKLSDERKKEIIKLTGLSRAALKTIPGLVKYIAMAMKLDGASRKEVSSRRAMLLAEGKQYKARSLRKKLKKKYKLSKKGRVKGYLGVTEADIYSDDHNYLFSNSARGYSVMSYDKFHSSEEGERGRSVLMWRMVKHAASCSFFILSIKRCSSADCVRAYSHGLKDLDRNPLQLCSWCRQQLKELKTAVRE